MPPVGEPLRSILGKWRKENPGVVLTLYELNDAALFASLAERLLDIVLTTQHALPANAVSSPLYREGLVVALPVSHPLASRESVDWNVLRHETLLVQGWDGSQFQREFYASRLGSGTEFRGHAVSKQGILALVSAGFGTTLAMASQAEAIFPGVIYRPILEADAWIEICLAWNPQSEDAAVGRFLAFMRDAAQSRRLLAGA
jgi:DNA-binding transcriptional LysR family regulator